MRRMRRRTARRSGGRAGLGADALDRRRRGADLHRRPVPSAESRSRQRDPRGRATLCGAKLLRRSPERLRDEGHEHPRFTARRIRQGALDDGVTGPGHRVRGPEGEAPPRQSQHRAPLDGRPAPERGDAGRQRRQRPHRLPALRLGRRRSWPASVRRQPLVRTSRRMQTVRPREDLGARRPAEGGGLRRIRALRPRVGRCWARLASRRPDSPRSGRAIPAAAYGNWLRP